MIISHLIIIEDLHWCDATTLEFLTNLVRRLTEQPFLLLLTYRSDEVDDNLRHFLATLDRTRLVKTLNLTRLALADTQAMIAAIFAQQAVRQEFADAIYHLTDGNPLIAIEYFTQALEAATHLDNKLPVNLLLGRGQLYERVGQFDRACADYEQALATAQGAHDQQTEWRAHFALGTLWSARDYQRAGDYLQRA